MSHWLGDAVPLRSVALPSTTGLDSEARRRCLECGVDCSDLHVAVFVSGWWYYCLPCGIEFTRAYLDEAARIRA